MRSREKTIAVLRVFCILCVGLALIKTPLLLSQEAFRTPSVILQSHYKIDARIDLEKKLIKGVEIIILKNTSLTPIRMIAIDWAKNSGSLISLKANGKKLPLINTMNLDSAKSPLFYNLPDVLVPGSTIEFEINFSKLIKFSHEDSEFKSTHWHPRLWWDNLPQHDSFSVKLDIPEGFCLAASGCKDQATGRFEAKNARIFGIYLGKGQKTKSYEVNDVCVTALFTEKGAACADICLETAVDVIQFYKSWLGFYPFRFLYIIPGGKGRWGGYPFATGIIAIHGQETYSKGESLYHWQHITAHEIGHEYWGEWVLDPDNPAWLWIGMGIFADTEYSIQSKTN